MHSSKTASTPKDTPSTGGTLSADISAFILRNITWTERDLQWMRDHPNAALNTFEFDKK